MAINRWKGIQKFTAQVNTITLGGTDASGQIYTVTINQKTVAFVSTGGGNAANAAGLLALLAACTEPEFEEVTWAASGTLAITGTAATAGKPFSQTSSATGTGTLVTAATVANTSPNDVNDPVNWSNGTVPATGDNVFIDSTNVSLLWNLTALAGVTPASLTIAMSFTGNGGSSGSDPTAGFIGLPEQNTDSTQYTEYRPQYLQFAGCSGLVTIGNGIGQGSGRIKLDFQAGAVTAQILNTGNPADTDLPALILKGSAINDLIVDGGSVGVAVFGNETATITTLNVASGGSNHNADAATVLLGAGVTWTNIVQGGNSTLTVQSGGGTLTQYAGTCVITAGSITTLNAGGTVDYLGNGTIGTINVLNGGAVDFTGDNQARTVTTCNVYGQHSINDANKTVTWTNGIQGQNCDPVADGELIVGKGRKVTPV